MGGCTLGDDSWTRAESTSPDGTDDVILSSPVPHFSGSDDSDELLPLQEVERRHIQQVLAATGGQLNRAAQILGIHRNTLRRKLHETE
jgi:DNA-binding protein Fis